MLNSPIRKNIAKPETYTKLSINISLNVILNKHGRNSETNLTQKF